MIGCPETATNTTKFFLLFSFYLSCLFSFCWTVQSPQYSNNNKKGITKINVWGNSFASTQTSFQMPVSQRPLPTKKNNSNKNTPSGGTGRSRNGFPKHKHSRLFIVNFQKFVCTTRNINTLSHIYNVLFLLLMDSLFIVQLIIIMCTPAKKNNKKTK